MDERFESSTKEGSKLLVDEMAKKLLRARNIACRIGRTSGMKEVPEDKLDHPAVYRLGLVLDENGRPSRVEDNYGYCLAQSVDPALIEDMVKSENEAWEKSRQPKTYRELIAMFAS
jgi:hypothetical protein